MHFLKHLSMIAIACIFASEANAFEILALGTSNTNCKGVDRSKTFTVHLEELLRADGIDATVINAGLDGDKPVWMINRMTGLVTGATRIVILEPGPNDRNKSSSVEFTEKMLGQLQEKKIPTIYVSHNLIQSPEEATALAAKYGAHFYGHFARNVPLDHTYRQYDQPGGPGHMTAEGCQLWAKNMLPLVEKVLGETSTKAP